MTRSELGVLPSGHLHWFPAEDAGDADRETGEASIADAFSRGIAEGLIALAAKEYAADLSPVLGYWRAFTCRYLAERCQMTPADPARPDPIGALDEPQTGSLLEGVPPMRGAEYLSPQVLNGIWSWLDDQVC
ncbi:MAG TPA: hypothetical protein ENH08_01295, partial [Chromatiales bacterium]|nr:hypothetical protein [Chromatiales bacterium]